LTNIIWKPTFFGFAKARFLDILICSICDSYSIFTYKCSIPQFNSLQYAWKKIGSIDNSIGSQNLIMLLENHFSYLYSFQPSWIAKKLTSLNCKILVVESKSNPLNPSYMIHNIKLRPNPHVAQVKSKWNWTTSILPLECP